MKAATRRYLVTAAALAAFLAPVPGRAHFESVVTSSRQLSLGGALVSVADDASATVINPAGLTELRGWSITSTYIRPYAVSGLDEAFAAAAVSVDRVGSFGVAFHYVGLRDVMTESLVTLALARDLIRTSEDASLSVGASVDLARVSASDRFDASDSGVTGGASVLLRPFPAIGVAYAIRNIAEPEFDLIAGGGKTTLERTQSWGLSYRWHQRVALIYERRDDLGEWREHVGVEVNLGPHLDLRSGVGRGLAAGGVGVSWGGISLDAGFSSHEVMGSSYVVTVGYSPPATAKPYAQSQ
jgi:hypothetical protein